MDTVVNVMYQVIGAFETVSLSFARGLYYNIKLSHLFHQKEEPFPEPVQEPEPPMMTELARRRAKVRKKEGADHPPTPKRREVKTVQGVLWWMIRNNLCISVMMLGMAQAIIPLFVRVFVGDGVQKNAVLGMVVSRLVMITWMIPIFMICKISNTFWMNDLSSLAYQDTMGKPVQPDMAVHISDLVYSTVMQIFFFIQVSAASWVPLRIHHINLAELVLTAVMYSMYAFEYKWMNMGIGVRRRLDLIDRNIAFHLGFGLPLAFATLYFNFWIGAMLSSIFFPILALSASYASEPKDIRGRSSGVFRPTERVVDWFFGLVHRHGLGHTVLVVLLLGLLAALCWLGLMAALYSLAIYLLAYLWSAAWLAHLWQSVLGWFFS